jgi:signal transduction histidine kinase/ketosteroid isomerase-like protein
MKLTKKLGKEILKTYNNYWENYLKGDVGAIHPLLTDEYTQVGSAESEVFSNKKEAVQFLYDTIDQVAGKLEMRNRKTTLEQQETSILIHEFCDLYALANNNWIFYSKFRASTFMQQKKEGWKIIHQHSSFPDTKTEDGQNIAIDKIAEENQQLREAVKRRTIELEQKNRELEIETALERVRTVAMAMQQPDVMLDICQIISTELQNLGVAEIRNIQTGIIDVSKDSYLNYEYFRLEKKKLVTVVEYKKHKEVHAFVKKMMKGPESFFTTQFKGVPLKQYIQYMVKAGQFVDPATKKTASLHYYFYSIGPGALGISSYAPLTKDAIVLFKQFRNVFQLAYRRFMDIEKAIAQAKEAQIELALERVRSRTMAMHKSDELKEIIMVVSEQLQKLGYKFSNVSFITHNKNYDLNFWLSAAGIKEPFLLQVPYFDNPAINNLKNAIESDSWFYTDILTADENQEWLQHLINTTWLNDAPQETKNYLLRHTPFAKTNIRNRHIALAIGNYAGIPYNDEENEVFKRFANVFEQSYTRFLDLQKAETQAREAQIETALERVRSRSLAMHKSDELGDVVITLLERLNELDIKPDGININILKKDSKSFDTWFAAPGYTKAICLPTPYFNHPVMNDAWDAFEAKKELYHITYTKEIKDSYFTYLYSHTPFKQMPEERKKMIMAAGIYNLSVALANNTAISVHNYSDRALSEKEHEILKRFSKVFQQCYTRFLDLQKAEAQAKEAQIETALEKVRSRTMAMQSSNELQETATVLFNEFKKLGTEDIYQVTIGIYNEDEGLIDFRVTSWAGSGAQENRSFKLEMKEPTVLQPSVHAWKANKKSLVIDLTGEALEGWLNYRNKMSGITVSSSDTAGRRVITIAYYSKGHLSISTPVPVPADTLRTLERFAAVFDSTYTRFLDLKKAEAQAFQAEQDLIAIKEAKQKAEEALTELQATQKQLIQSEKMASLGELTAGIAHEIQNPLNFVNNFSEVSTELVDEMNEELAIGNTQSAKEIANDLKQNLEKINHHGKRAGDIVKGMLQHSRSSSGVKEPTNINALADEYLRLAYHGLRAKDKTFNATTKTDFDASIGNINIIPQDIGRVILNLITNAFYVVNEKSKQGLAGYEPTVEVNTKKEGNKVLISVKDNGNGIPEAIREKVFQPFFTTKPTGQGTGLGLSLSYDIIKAHGGELKVETEEGNGSEFIIQLPVV